MDITNPLHQKNQWLIILALVLVGLNLRPSMAAIGPLLSLMRVEISFNYTLISLLTMLPVLTMGLAMFYGVRFSNKIGVHNAIALALVLIGLSSFARLYTDDVMDLILTAVVAGLGISIVQASLPGLIKSHFPRSVALLMGLYITAIMAGAALAAASTSYFAVYFASWRAALAIWSGLAAFALALWFVVRKQINNQKIENNETQLESFIRRPRAWLLGIFFGLNTAAYTCILAWLAPYYMDKGWQDIHSGLLLAYLTTVEVIAGLTIPLLASYKEDRRPFLYMLLCLLMIGFSGLALAPLAYPILWASLLGLGIGGLFPLSLIVPMDHLHSANRAGQLTAFVQGVGYIIAAFSPLFAGFIKDLFASFELAWLSLVVIAVVMLFMAWRFAPQSYARQFR